MATRHWYLAAPLLLVLPLSVAAGDEPPAELEELIEVKGARVGTETNVGAARTDAEGLAARRATTGDAAELLRGVPGVTVNGAGGISSLPSVHGLADDRLRVQVDGTDVVAACPNHMNSPLSYADPTRIESVTVFAGITPVSVGGDSIGGSIQVKSSAPEFASATERFVGRGLAGSFYRSNGDALGYDLAAAAAGEWLSLTLGQSDSRADSYRAAGAFKPVTPGREGGADIRGDVVAASAYRGSLRRRVGLALKAGGHLVQVEASRQRVGFEGFPNQRMDMTANDNRLYTLRYTGTLPWGSLEGRLSYQDTRHEMDMGPDRYSYGTGMPMSTEARTWAASLGGTVTLSGGHLLRLGAELQHHTLYDFWPAAGGTMGPGTFWNVDFGQRRRIGGFVEWEARWTDTWLGQLGLRSDTVTTDAGPVRGYDDALPAWGVDAAAFNASERRRVDHNWDAAALARLTPGPTQAYEGGYAHKSRSPNLHERYAWSTNAMAALMNNFVGDGNGYVGRIELRPEVADTVSVTGDWHDPAQAWLGVRATAYYTHVSDFIDARRCDTGQCGPDNATATRSFVLLRYANVAARLVGVDLAARWLVAESPTSGGLTAKLAASYVRGDNLSSGDGLYDIMPPNGTLSLVYQLGTWTSTAELVAVASKTRVSRVRNELSTGAYQLVNLRGSFRWRFVRVDVGVENLLDRLYFNPVGGAYAGQGPSMSTSGLPWGVGVPGPARTFTAALTVDLRS